MDKFILTPERLTTLRRMKADYELNPTNPPTKGGQWYRLIKTNADSGTRYSDNGMWGALMYQITGDPAYVAKAWTQLQSGTTHAGGGFLTWTGNALKGNGSREFFWQFVAIYDWLETGLTQAQKDQFLAKLKEMLVATDTNAFLNPPHRPGDSDQMVGDFMGAAMLALKFPADTAIQNIWNKSYFGTLTAPVADYGTYRRAIRLYCEKYTQGGVWFESDEYNLGTLKLLLLGSEAIRTATGSDYFPEVTALLPNLAKFPEAELTPDWQDAAQWGDEENPHDLRLFYRVETAMVLAGLTGSPSLQAMIEHYDVGADPWCRGFLVYDPYVITANRSLDQQLFAPGIGYGLHRTPRSLFQTLSPQTVWASGVIGEVYPNNHSGLMDHVPVGLGEFRLWQDGEWVINHPLCYGSTTGMQADGRSINGAIVGGFPFNLSSPSEFRKPVAWTQTPDYTYVAATCAGQLYPPGYYNGPSTFCHEYTRNIVYLPGFDTVVVFDRANIQDPRTMLTGYTAAEQTRLNALPALKQWFVHTPSSPSLTPGKISWLTGQGVPINVYHPGDFAQTIENEIGWPSNVTIPERKWHVRLSPPDRRWDAAPLVWACGSGITVTVTGSTVTVSKGGRTAVLVFDAVQGLDLADGRRPNAGTVWPTSNQSIFNSFNGSLQSITFLGLPSAPSNLTVNMEII